ncbi:hypothetical protein [Dethiothermospora halolimnae]|uniref:hypothetical protein n=1 Tax=Dethiothermospora halolimnae TaxID=3114390 RepID=UPI003CCBBD30
MKDIDVIGYKVEKGIEILTSQLKQPVNIFELRGTNKKLDVNLKEGRILNVKKGNNSIDVFVGYF